MSVDMSNEHASTARLHRVVRSRFLRAPRYVCWRSLSVWAVANVHSCALRHAKPPRHAARDFVGRDRASVDYRMRCAALVALLVPAVSFSQAADIDLAKQHYQTGRLHYERGDFDKALAEFEAAYRLSPRPELQYNIAQACERLLYYDRALFAYEAYLLGRPNAPDRKFVESRIEFLKRHGSGNGWKRTLGWVGIGVGAAAAGVGVAFGVRARNKASELEDANAEQRLWDDVSHLQDQGERAEVISIVGLVVGGVGLVGGALLLITAGDESNVTYTNGRSLVVRF